jgi:HD-GYP domain-containing protein (c-di-GMP phosphodiesterase class II)
MHILPLAEIKPGMKLARTIYREEDGGVLLRPNIELKPNYITRIQELKYNHIYILDPGDAEDSIIDDQVDDETRYKARSILKKTAKLMEGDEKVNLRNISNVVEEIISQIFRKLDFVYNTIDIRSPENYVFAHSVNVCIIALMIGTDMGFNRVDLAKLGIGAMLHDIGMLFSNTKDNRKLNLYNPQDAEIVKKHPRVGYELLKSKTELNFLSGHVALQHHEREDGSGYPRGLTSKRIHRFAKVIAVADDFDTMVHRGYYKGLAPYQAIEELRAKAMVKYDRLVIDSFLKIMAPYPVGSILVLSNGDTVTVEFVSRLECRVKVMEGDNVGKSYNLYQNGRVTVVKYQAG